MEDFLPRFTFRDVEDAEMFASLITERMGQLVVNWIGDPDVKNQLLGYYGQLYSELESLIEVMYEREGKPA